MKQTHPHYATAFFVTSLLFASIASFSAAYISYQPALKQWLFPLILASLSSPTIAALLMLYREQSPSLWADFRRRLTPRSMKLGFMPLLFFFMPFMVLLAITISLVFGFSPHQFSFSSLSPDQALEGKNFIAIVLIVFLTCSLEEIGWRGYGIESLRNQYNLWKTSWIFAAFWSLWHVPAFFIKDGYFQQEVLNVGPIATVTYFMTLFPVTFLINWVYMKNNRTIMSAILAHATMNLSVVIFQIQPFTKIIFMLLLALAAAFVVWRDKALFFEKSPIQ